MALCALLAQHSTYGIHHIILQENLALCPCPQEFFAEIILVDVSALKKYLALPKIPQFAADTLPAPRPFPLLATPPLPGIFNKNQPPYWRLGLPLRPPRPPKKIQNVHQVILVGKTKSTVKAGPITVLFSAKTHQK